MPTSVVSAWLATPRPPSGTVPIRPDDGRVGQQEQRLGDQRAERGDGQPQDLAVLRAAARRARGRGPARPAPGAGTGPISNHAAGRRPATSSALRPRPPAPCRCRRPAAAARSGCPRRRPAEARRGRGLDDAADLGERRRGRARADARGPRPGRAPGRRRRRCRRRPAAHSSRLRLANTAAKRRRSSGQPDRSCWAGQAGAGQPQAVEQRGVELRLQRADGHVAAVGGLVGVIERRAAVQQC